MKAVYGEVTYEKRIIRVCISAWNIRNRINLYEHDRSENQCHGSIYPDYKNNRIII